MTVTKFLTRHEHPDGFYVDCDGKVRSTEIPGVGLYCMFEKHNDYTCVLECSLSTHEVIGEYVYYPDRNSIEVLLSKIKAK